MADLCNEVPKGVRAPGKPAAPDHLEKMEHSYRPLYCRKFYQCTATEEPCARIRAKIRTIVGRPKNIQTLFWCGFETCQKGQYFCTPETEDGKQMQHLCREYTMPRNEKGTRVRGWIRMDKRIGPVLNIKVCYRNELYRIEVPVPSLFQDDTASWVRIVNGVDRYVTESMPTAKEEDIASEKPIAKARPRQKPTVTLTSVSIPVLERKWIDIQTQRSHDQKVLQSVNSCHPIATTWWISPTRKRRSDPQQWHHPRVQDAEVRRRFAILTGRLVIKTGMRRRRRTEEKISKLWESKLFQSIPVPSSN